MMSEPKLCPYRKTFGEKYEEHQIEIDGIGKLDSIKGEVFGYCLQDKCAMWRDEKADLDEGRLVPGHCGLAGKP
jgi:hypothetical protein